VVWKRAVTLSCMRQACPLLGTRCPPLDDGQSSIIACADKAVLLFLQVIDRLDKHTSRAVTSPGQAYEQRQAELGSEYKKRAGPC
jgi:hypothetical protein